MRRKRLNYRKIDQQLKSHEENKKIEGQEWEIDGQVYYVTQEIQSQLLAKLTLDHLLKLEEYLLLVEEIGEDDTGAYWGYRDAVDLYYAEMAKILREMEENDRE